jgi:outer membrane immunogenic protein
MKFAQLTGAGLLVLVTAATPTRAADVPAPVAKSPAAVVAPPFSWTGPYAGLHCGYAWGRTSSRGDNGAFDDSGITLSIRDVGWICGGQAGYTWQAGTWVYGVEGDLGYLAVKDSVTVDDNFASVKYGWYGTLTGRFGPTWDRSMLYLKGGLAAAGIRNTASDLDTGFDPLDFSTISKTKWGWALGAGFEQALQPNWTWKVEYLYMDFGKRTSGNADGNTFEHRNRVQTIKLGLNYRFATGKSPAPVVTKY